MVPPSILNAATLVGIVFPYGLRDQLCARSKRPPINCIDIRDIDMNVRWHGWPTINGVSQHDNRVADARLGVSKLSVCTRYDAQRLGIQHGL